MTRANESRREEAISALSALYEKHRKLPFPCLEGRMRTWEAHY